MSLRKRRATGVTKVVPGRKRRKESVRVKRAGDEFKPRKIETQDPPKRER